MTAGLIGSSQLSGLTYIAPFITQTTNEREDKTGWTLFSASQAKTKPIKLLCTDSIRCDTTWVGSSCQIVHSYAGKDSGDIRGMLCFMALSKKKRAFVDNKNRTAVLSRCNPVFCLFPFSHLLLTEPFRISKWGAFALATMSDAYGKLRSSATTMSRCVWEAEVISCLEASFVFLKLLHGASRSPNGAYSPTVYSTESAAVKNFSNVKRRCCFNTALRPLLRSQGCSTALLKGTLLVAFACV